MVGVTDDKSTTPVKKKRQRNVKPSLKFLLNATAGCILFMMLLFVISTTIVTIKSGQLPSADSIAEIMKLTEEIILALAK